MIIRLLVWIYAVALGILAAFLVSPHELWHSIALGLVMGWQGQREGKEIEAAWRGHMRWQ